MEDRSADSPFRFVSCMELRESLGKRAQDLERLLEIIEEVPADSIYYHTHSYYLRHPYTQENCIRTTLRVGWYDMRKIACSVSDWASSTPSTSTTSRLCGPN